MSAVLSEAGAFEVDDAGVVVGGDHGPLVLSVDGQYVWSFTPARDGQVHRRGVLVEWPVVLRRFLDGRGTVTIAEAASGEVLYEAEVALGDGVGPLRIVDGSGHPLSVDKVGHLTRSFADTDESVRLEILRGTQRALSDLREGCGVEAYLNYGALLGAVRDGAMIAHDSDTDVCYVSDTESPADLIAESYRIEREMLRRGWKLIRMSGGDIKLLLPLSDGRQCHIDIFVAFWQFGVFYQLGNRSGHLPREAVLPVSTIELHGHEFPAPADPEAMLAFIYGEGWRVPDPSFTYRDPRDGVRRLDGWLRGFRTHMGRWSEFHSGPGRQHRKRRSDFARWVRDQIGPDTPIADIGAGAGKDASWWARQGHTVRAYEFSLAGRARITRLAAREGIDLGPYKLTLGETRSVLANGADLARNPHHLTARLLLGCLDDAERANFWRLARLSLRGTGRALFLEFSARGTGLVPREQLHDPQPSHLVRRLDVRHVRREIEEAGGRIEHIEVGPGTDVTDTPDPSVCRMRVTWTTERNTP
ncbi:MAG: class I SAM-dependent methyltransferase [Nocardioides sp.]|uniref:class I SAM-dependent methyltransferase n=1 Tax=Nocardioides sp. TaxID=35761 RepID=UPI003F06E9E3